MITEQGVRSCEMDDAFHSWQIVGGLIEQVANADNQPSGLLAA